MKEVKAEDSDSIEDIVELSLLYSGSDVTSVSYTHLTLPTKLEV